MRANNHYGIAAEFEDPASLVEAARALHHRGFVNIEAYTPYPIRQLDEIIEHRIQLPYWVLAGGILGTLTGWSLQTYVAVIDFPINVGGRPLYSWPSFIVIMFELTILFAALTAFFGTLVGCRLPRLHHPIFNVPDFGQASNNRFFLCVEVADPKFDRDEIAEILAPHNPTEIRDVADD